MAVVGAVGQAGLGGRHRPDQGCRGPQIAKLPRGDDEGDGPASPIDDSMNFGAAPARERPMAWASAAFFRQRRNGGPWRGCCRA